MPLPGIGSSISSPHHQDKIPTPPCGCSALCPPQGPARVSSLILGADPVLTVHSAAVTFAVSLVPDTKTFSVLSPCSYPVSLNRPGSGPFSSFRSRLRDVLPPLQAIHVRFPSPGNICHVNAGFIVSRSVTHNRNALLC